MAKRIRCHLPAGAPGAGLTLAATAMAIAALAMPAIAEAKSPPPPPATPDVAYQLNAAHTGVTGDTFSTGAKKRWSVTLAGGGISYPLIVNGVVYVTAADTGYGTRLYALNATTGATLWGPIELYGSYDWSGLTYANGSVFTLNGSGLMTSFNASTGAQQWSTQLPGQYSFTSAPTAFGGLLYTGGAGSGGTVYAVNESNGTVAWTGQVMNGDESSPAVSPAGMYVSYACGQTYDFAPTTGTLIWHRSTGCEGGGGKTPVLANGALYVRDFSYPAVLDAGTGNVLGAFSATGPAPAVTSSTVYDLASGKLTASAIGGANAWTFAGDGTLSSAPLVAGGTVFVAGTSGNVYALSNAGKVVWHETAGAPVPAPDEQNVSQPLTGLGFSGGLLVVPAGTQLVAFR